MSANRNDARSPGRRAVLVSSPDAGNAIHAEHLVEQLARVGITIKQNLLVSDLDHASPQGTLWRDQGYELAIAAGGDGTVGSVATQLIGSDVPLAILPMGTANDVARSLHVPLALEDACVAIAGAVPMAIDVGQVIPGLIEPGAYTAERHGITLAGGPSPLAGVCFLHAMTLGLNVEFARLATDSQRRQRFGSLTYAASALEAVTRYHPIDVTLRLFGLEGEDENAEQVIHSQAVQVSIVNTPVIGGRMGVRLPDISLQDRQLDFLLIEALDAQQLRHTVEQLLAALGGLSARQDQVPASEPGAQVPHLPGVRRFRARAAILETTEAVDVTLDGEIRTHTPAFVRVAQHQLRVLVSPQAKYLLMRDESPDDTGAAL